MCPQYHAAMQVDIFFSRCGHCRALVPEYKKASLALKVSIKSLNRFVCVLEPRIFTRLSFVNRV